MTPNYPKKTREQQQQQQEEKWFLEPPFAVKNRKTSLLQNMLHMSLQFAKAWVNVTECHNL
jgi:hypothetical protein